MGRFSRALVLGGTGAVGSAVVRRLLADGTQVAFTWLKNEDRAAELIDAGAQGHRVQLADADAVRAFVEDLGGPDLFVHAAVSARQVGIAETSVEDWNDAVAVNVRAPFVAIQALLPGFAQRGGGEVVLSGALDRGQSLPLPAAFSASQGALGAMAMAMAKELGGMGVRVNVLALGLLTGGLSEALAPELVDAYQRFSALRRLGTPDEIAGAIVGFAEHNRYVNGKVVPINGGI